MNKLEKTLATIAAAATLAGCIGSPEPRYRGIPKRDGTAKVDSSSTVQSDTAAVATPTRAVYDQTKDPELDLWNADRPFLIPREPRYQPAPTRPLARPAPEPRLPLPEYQPEGELY